MGESGCGKSTTGRLLLDLIPPTSGTVAVRGQSTHHTSKGKALAKMRRRFQIVFQDPYASLNPRMTVGRHARRTAARCTSAGDDDQIARRVQELLTIVGLSPEHANRFPHEFSGGQRQRVGIARALALEPELIVLDEPVSALDVSIQAGVVNLLERLQDQLGLAYVFIAHDLSVVRHISDRVAVMYLGKIVEDGTGDDDLQPARPPLHAGAAVGGPAARPRREQRPRAASSCTATCPRPADPPTGCRFRTRCWKKPSSRPAASTRPPASSRSRCSTRGGRTPGGLPLRRHPRGRLASRGPCGAPPSRRTRAHPIVVGIHVIVSVLLIVLVLLHSGKGGGLSDMFGGSVGATALGSTAAERNLDRITVVVALIFVFTTIGLAFLLDWGRARRWGPRQAERGRARRGGRPARGVHRRWGRGPLPMVGPSEPGRGRSLAPRHRWRSHRRSCRGVAGVGPPTSWCSTSSTTGSPTSARTVSRNPRSRRKRWEGNATAHRLPGSRWRLMSPSPAVVRSPRRM